MQCCGESMEQNDVFERLKSAVIKAQNELDLPDHIADSVMEIASRPTFFASKAKIVGDLAEMVLDYHTYAEACCERLGASASDIQYVVGYIKSSVKGS